MFVTVLATGFTGVGTAVFATVLTALTASHATRACVVGRIARRVVRTRGPTVTTTACATAMRACAGVVVSSS